MPDEQKTSELGEPYCANCGYVLTGTTDSSKCPECGLAIVDVLMRKSLILGSGKRYRSRATIFGMPVLDVAFGPYGNDPVGRARGFIALGTQATGVLAVGGQSRGVVAVGGFAMGGFTLGGMSIGLCSMGGFCIGLLAAGGWAMGLLAQGGGAVGVVAQGGMGFGWFVRAGGAFGRHTISPRGFSESAAKAFEVLSFYFGGVPPTATGILTSVAGMFLAMAATAGVIGIMALRASSRHAGGT